MSVVNTGTLFCFPLLENAVKNSEHILADEENRAENCGQQMRLVLAGCFAIVGLFIIGRHNYLLFHALVELGAVAVAWSVFFSSGTPDG